MSAACQTCGNPKGLGRGKETWAELRPGSKILIYYFGASLKLYSPRGVLCRRQHRNGDMTDATYDRDVVGSGYQQAGSNWTVLLGGAATMFAMAAAAFLWV